MRHASEFLFRLAQKVLPVALATQWREILWLVIIRKTIILFEVPIIVPMKVHGASIIKIKGLLGTPEFESVMGDNLKQPDLQGALSMYQNWRPLKVPVTSSRLFPTGSNPQAPY